MVVRRPGTTGYSGVGWGERLARRLAKASFSAGSTFRAKWLGAFSGSWFCQVSSSSPRSRAISAMARRIRPNARDCPAAASGWRSSWPSPRRQGSVAPARSRRSALRPDSSRPPSNRAAIRPPPSRARVSFRSRLRRHMIRPRASSAAPYTSQALGGSGSRSRRNTRSGGTRPSAARGGRAKPARASRPVAMPASAGTSPPEGITAGSSPPSSWNRTDWATQPSRAPRALASNPSSASCRPKSSRASRRDRPRQRSRALAS
ncbi:hypothetical protein D9M68_342570 [compost metagenome]